MAKSKKELVDEQVDGEVETPKVESPAKAALRVKLQEYADANPDAWKIRGERLLARLESMQ